MENKELLANEFVSDGYISIDNGGFAGPIGDPVPVFDEKGGYMGEDDFSNVSAETNVPMGQKLMGSWLFLGGVSAGVLIVGVLLGILAGKHRIKKGFDLYED